MTAQPARILETPPPKTPVTMSPVGRSDWKELKLGPRALYGVIESFAYKSKLEGGRWTRAGKEEEGPAVWRRAVVSLSKLSETMGKGVASVRRYKEDLEAGGWIAVTKAGGKLGKSLEYLLLKHHGQEDRAPEQAPEPVWLAEERERYAESVRHWQGLRDELRGLEADLGQAAEEERFEDWRALHRRKNELEAVVRAERARRKRAKDEGNEPGDFFGPGVEHVRSPDMDTSHAHICIPTPSKMSTCGAQICEGKAIASEGVTSPEVIPLGGQTRSPYIAKSEDPNRSSPREDPIPTPSGGEGTAPLRTGKVGNPPPDPPASAGEPPAEPAPPDDEAPPLPPGMPPPNPSCDSCWGNGYLGYSNKICPCVTSQLPPPPLPPLPPVETGLDKIGLSPLAPDELPDGPRAEALALKEPLRDAGQGRFLLRGPDALRIAASLAEGARRAGARVRAINEPRAFSMLQQDWNGPRAARNGGDGGDFADDLCERPAEVLLIHNLGANGAPNDRWRGKLRDILEAAFGRYVLVSTKLSPSDLARRYGQETADMLAPLGAEKGGR